MISSAGPPGRSDRPDRRVRIDAAGSKEIGFSPEGEMWRGTMLHIGKTLTALVGAAILALTVPCAPAAAEDGVIRVGMTLRMIVENGIKYGQMTRDELLAANATGGINGHKVEVILLDDECNAQKGVANANRFIEQDKVHLIVGSICSSVTLPLVDVTARAQVPMISPTSTARAITEKGSAWVFRAAASARYFAAVHST